MPSIPKSVDDEFDLKEEPNFEDETDTFDGSLEYEDSESDASDSVASDSAASETDDSETALKSVAITSSSTVSSPNTTKFKKLECTGCPMPNSRIFFLCKICYTNRELAKMNCEDYKKVMHHQKFLTGGVKP